MLHSSGDIIIIITKINFRMLKVICAQIQSNEKSIVVINEISIKYDIILRDARKNKYWFEETTKR